MKPGIEKPVTKTETLFIKWFFLQKYIFGSLCTIRNDICLCTSWLKHKKQNGCLFLSNRSYIIAFYIILNRNPKINCAFFIPL